VLGIGHAERGNPVAALAGDAQCLPAGGQDAQFRRCPQQRADQRRAGRDDRHEHEGEDIAAVSLEAEGWSIVARNFRWRGGEIDIVVPAYVYSAGGENSVSMSRQSSSQAQQSSMEMHANSTSQQNEAVQYSVQLIDEVNQRSALLKDKVRRIEPTLPQTVQKTQPKAAIGTIGIDAKNPVNTAINTTIGLVGNIGQLPDVKNVSIKNWSENRVSFSFEATGAKGIDKIVFEVRDSHGNIANQNTILCNSEKQCSRQSESLSLSPGSYSLSVAAMDIENNSSKKVEKGFQVTAGTGSVQTQQPAQQQVMQPASPQTSTTPSSQGDDPGIVYEKE